jgi:hypothetical protein
MLGWHTKNEIHVASYPRDYAHITYCDMGNMRSDQRDWIWRIYHSKRLEGKSVENNFMCCVSWNDGPQDMLNLI